MRKRKKIDRFVFLHDDILFNFFKRLPDASFVIELSRYFYWGIYSSNHLVFMDIVREKIFQMSLPGRGLRRRCDYSLFVMGGFLALFDGVSWDKAEIRILKDLKMMKWEKLQNWSFRVSPGTCRYRVSGVITDK
ncbi:unnamed protein product [Lactuca saligna]|uniref:F-box associated domain-containing protein n=1 Tax=Lactuca saligna TaxID=75948 RepID=A0AA35Z7W9_LACSI|nr:unnamed protein product [Lactuca saligna]